MDIAIVSDIHDEVWNLEAALPHLRDADAVLCCGDLCSPFVLARLASGISAPIHIVFGNNDGDLYRSTETAQEHDHVHLHGTFFQGEVEGATVAMTHYPDVANAIDDRGADLIAYGHDHRFHIGAKGSAVLVNPGPLMGWLPSEARDVPPTFAVYHTQTGRCSGFRLTADGGVAPHQG